MTGCPPRRSSGTFSSCSVPIGGEEKADRHVLRDHPARYVEATGQIELVRDLGRGVDINAAGDVAVLSSGYAYVCPDNGGVIAIDDNIVDGDPDLVNLWQSRYHISDLEMNDAAATSAFGQLAGVILVPDEAGDYHYLVYVLTPTPAAQ